MDKLDGGATPYPAASGGSPLFDGSTSQALVAAGPASTWYGVNDRHVVAVVDLVGISNNDTGNTLRQQRDRRRLQRGRPD